MSRITRFVCARQGIERMIIVKLAGGLGNQMFQYATGLGIAKSRCTPCKVDLSFLKSVQEGGTRRSYGLNKLSLRIRIATRWETEVLSSRRLSRFLQTVFDENSALLPTVLEERHFHFDPAVLDAPRNAYLDGFWQSEKYFKSIRSELLKGFLPCRPLEGRNLEIANRMKHCDAVSVHVRRGDYVSSPETAAFHGICSLEYYQRGIDAFTDTLNSPEFFVFSDEPDWVRENFDFSIPIHIIDYNGADSPEEDVRLMSLCRYHIIANSALSWWGAWLSENKGRKVVAPKRWFLDPEIDTSDLLPDSWVRI